MITRSKIKHFLHCVLLISIICLMEYYNIQKNRIIENSLNLNPWIEYGIIGTCILYGLRILALLPLPQDIFNFFGLVCYNAFSDKVTLKSSPALSSVICIRVVTRGDYPELVRNNVDRNIKICNEAGLENFYIEVVSDKPISFGPSSKLRPLVIPKDYRTSSGALFKARALQYCLEEKVNILSDKDWIVHLDEETILTVNCIRGILNFIFHNKYHIGQGLITYANEKIVNWMTTLADSFRVADDMGKLRLQFKAFHKPLFSFKGSYVVTQFNTESSVSFDNGPDGSIAEDCYFAVKAASMGYTFDFIEGEMWEKSPFTINDFIQQRKRWLQGVLLVVHSKSLPVKSKLLICISFYAWVTMPLALANVFIVPLFPVPSYPVLDFLVTFIGAVKIYMYIYGVVKSFSVKRYGVIRLLLCLLGSVAVISFSAIIESIAVLWGYFGKKHQFYVVQKDAKIQEIIRTA